MWARARGSNMVEPLVPCLFTVSFSNMFSGSYSYGLDIPKQTSSRNPSKKWIGKSVDLWYTCELQRGTHKRLALKDYSRTKTCDSVFGVPLSLPSR